MKQERQIVFYKNYFIEFYTKQNEPVRKKIDYIFSLINKVEQIPEKFLKHIEGTKGLYEIRIEQSRNIFRIFCCFDKNNLVVLLNAFQKKTSKTPKKVIELALKLMREYFQNKVNMKF